MKKQRRGMGKEKKLEGNGKGTKEEGEVIRDESKWNRGWSFDLFPHKLLGQEINLEKGR